jgi:hypothetical protein
MLVIPAQFNASQFSLFVILNDENIERIREYDPGEVVLSQMPAKWQRLKLKDIVLMFCPQEDVPKFIELVNKEGPQAGLKMLARGFRHRPDRGDDDEYKSLREPPEETPASDDAATIDDGPPLQIKIVKKAHAEGDPENLVRVSVGGGPEAGGYYCVYRGTKEQALDALKACRAALVSLVKHLGDKEPDIEPDDGKKYA